MTPTEIKDRFFALLGAYPVIVVSETCNDSDYPDTYRYDDYFNEAIDIALLEEIGEWSFNYVEHLFGDILAQLERGAAATQFNIGTSRKYSFGDTPDWWEKMVVPFPRDRIVLHLDIAVHS